MERRPKAADLAAALRHELRLGDGYLDIFEVLRRLGIEVYRAPFDDDSLEGAHEIRNGQPYIIVNSSRSITRQRSTAAHELGHNRLGHDKVYEASIEPSGDDGDEWDAYRFGRYFLMDPAGVEGLVTSMEDEAERVAAVASHFVVSPQLAAIHLAELHLIKTKTKADLLEGFRTNALRPAAFLRRYGYRMAATEQDVREVDPGHAGRAMRAYASGLMTLEALADTLLVTLEEAAEHVRDAGLTAPTDDDGPGPGG